MVQGQGLDVKGATYGRLGGLNADSFVSNDDTAWRIVWPSFLRSFCSPEHDVSSDIRAQTGDKRKSAPWVGAASPFSAGSSASASTSSASCCSLAASSSPEETTFFSVTFLAFDTGAPAAGAAASVLTFLPRLLTGVSVAGAGAALRLGRPAPPSAEGSAGGAAPAPAGCSSVWRARLVVGRRGEASSLSSILSFRASSTASTR